MKAFAMHTKPFCLLLASFVSFFFIVPAAPVGAQTAWNGNVDTDWFTAGNWSTNIVPTSSTDVDISSAVTAVINASGAVSDNASIGLIAGSGGMVDVSGGSWANSGNLTVGDSGAGVLSLSAGTVSNTGSSLVAAAYLGFNAGSSGTVTVSGGNLTSNNRLWVGYSGAGELNISGTAAVSNFACVLGNFAGSSGTANVSGGTWHTRGIFVVGQQGTGELNISGGQVTHQFSGVTVGASASGTANVSGGTWTPLSLSIGSGSTGTLNISGAGAVSSSGDATLGAGSAGSGTANVSGGTWTHTILHVGQVGAGQLTISGGSVLSSAGYLGENATASGTATVSGGTWTVNNEFIVGNIGAGVLSVSGSGTVNVADGIGNTTLGLIGGSSGIANVSGGTWTNNGVFIGSSGTGELNISGAGAVSSDGGVLGDKAGGSGTATVNGGTWTISGALSVGADGTGVLNVSNTGAVSNATGILGFNTGSSGTANVSGGTWTSSLNLIVGRGGVGELNLSGTGVVSVGAGGGGTVSLASQAGSTGTLNFGNGAGAPGTLLATQVGGGAGTAKVNFNHTSTAYSFAPQLNGSLAVEVMQGTTIFTAANTYTGGTTISGGTLTLANPSGAGTGAIEVDGGTLDITDQTIGNTITFGALGGTIKSGGASGGTINSALSLTNTNQILSPGNSPGILAFGTSQSWDSGAYLWQVNDWTGTTAGTDFDQIQINGGLTLTGASEGSYILDITSLMAGNLAGDVSNFSDTDQSWTLLTTTNGITGFDASFWTLDAASFESSPDWTGEFSIIQVANDLLLNYTVVAEPATGDFDLDGDVDGGDFLVWQRGGSPSPLSAGDLADWQANYGFVPLASSQAVPEPGSVLLTALGLLGLAASIRRKRVRRSMQFKIATFSIRDLRFMEFARSPRILSFVIAAGVGMLGAGAAQAAVTFTGLGDLPDGSFFSMANGVSADGAVVVGTSSSASGGQAFRWEGGVMTGLGDVSGGGLFSGATSASADGSIVVGAGTEHLGGAVFVWDSVHGMRNLRDLLTNDVGLDLTGWTLGTTHISANGRAIAGVGTNPNGNTEAWRVLAEPEWTSTASGAWDGQVNWG